MLLPCLPYTQSYTLNKKEYDLFTQIDRRDLNKTFWPWENNRFNLVASMENHSPLVMHFYLNKGLRFNEMPASWQSTLLVATFTPRSAYTHVDITIHSNKTYLVATIIFTMVLVASVFVNAEITGLLIALVAFLLLDMHGKYRLKKSVEKLLEVNEH